MKTIMSNLKAVENPKLIEVEVDTRSIKRERCYHDRYRGFGIFADYTGYVKTCEDCGADISHLLVTDK